MKKEVRSPALSVLLVFALLAVSPRTAFSTIDSTRENQIKSAVQDVFQSHGFSVEKSNIILLSDEDKITLAMDISENISRLLAEQIIQKIRSSTSLFPETKLEMNLFGSADGHFKLSEANVSRSKEWNDALADVGRGTIVKAGITDDSISLSKGETAFNSFQGAYQNADFEKARSIILVHLIKIRDSGAMGNSILMESYWKDVFRQAHAVELFDMGRPLVTQALSAGIKPYREGKSLEASTFADLAMNALGLQPIKGAGASVILFKP